MVLYLNYLNVKIGTRRADSEHQRVALFHFQTTVGRNKVFRVGLSRHRHRSCRAIQTVIHTRTDVVHASTHHHRRARERDRQRRRRVERSDGSQRRARRHLVCPNESARFQTRSHDRI